MTKGGWAIPTRVISVRVPLTVYSIIERRAQSGGMSVGDWVKLVVISHQHIASVNTPEGGESAEEMNDVLEGF